MPFLSNLFDRLKKKSENYSGISCEAFGLKFSKKTHPKKKKKKKIGVFCEFIRKHFLQNISRGLLLKFFEF